MSLFADYLKEKTNDQIIESEIGFATYRYLDKESVYIVDLYVKPAYRQQKAASSIADIIVELAKKKGCKKLLGSVVPSTKGSTESVKVLLAYGMSLDSSVNDFITFKKDI